jgi:hypothetical protein
MDSIEPMSSAASASNSKDIEAQAARTFGRL